jgi:LysM repeat protein
MEINPQTEKSSRTWPRRSASFFAAALLVVLVFLAGAAVHSWLIPAQGIPSTASLSTESLVGAAKPLPQIPRPGVNLSINRAVAPHTEADDTVQAGDYLFAIAEKFQITPETILWSNYAVLKDNPELLVPGQTLFILPVDGVYYQWQTGDRLDTVAGSFGVTPEDIIFWPSNDLSPTIDIQNPGIIPGMWLVIPGGHREFEQWEMPVIRKTDSSKWAIGGEGACTTGPYSGPAGTGIWTWPTASHWVCGNEYTAYHHGIDLYITMDEPLHAADRGVVVYAGWNTWGYGNLVVIDHGNGWQTVYAHLDAVEVFCGAIVQWGGEIGLGGTTGNSTGPHLHFEMIYNGVRVNPHQYLP